MVCVQEIDKPWTTLLIQGMRRGDLLLALGTPFTGSNAKFGLGREKFSFWGHRGAHVSGKSQ